MKKIFLMCTFVSALSVDAQQKSLFVASAYWCSDSTKNLEATLRGTIGHFTGACTYANQDGFLKTYVGYGAIPGDGKTVWSIGPVAVFQHHNRFRIPQKTYVGVSANFVRLSPKWDCNIEISVLKNFSPTPAAHKQQTMNWFEFGVTKHFSDRFGVGTRWRYLYQNELDVNPIPSYYPQFFFCDSKRSLRGSLFAEIRVGKILFQPGVSVYLDNEQYPYFELPRIKTNKVGFDLKIVYLFKRL